MALFVIIVQVLLAGVEGVSVLHSELTHTDQPGSGARLVPELGLNLIDHKGVLGVGAGVFSYQLHRSLLVGHTQHHIGTVAVRKAQQLFADTLIPAGLCPQRGGHHHRELHFLTVQGVHLFPHDLLQLLQHPL